MQSKDESAGKAGAATLDILTQYVNTIKALKEVDPRGTLLNAVDEPIKAYLRGRPDTIRCIVHSLTNDNADDSLFGELTQPADNEVGKMSSQHCDLQPSFAFRKAMQMSRRMKDAMAWLLLLSSEHVLAQEQGKLMLLVNGMYDGDCGCKESFAMSSWKKDPSCNAPYITSCHAIWTLNLRQHGVFSSVFYQTSTCPPTCSAALCRGMGAMMMWRIGMGFMLRLRGGQIRQRWA